MFLGVLLGLVSLLLLAGGAVIGFFAQRSWRRASLLGCPLSRIGKLQPGLRKVRGTVAAVGKPLRSPMDNQKCVYFRFYVQEYRTIYKEPFFVVEEPSIGRSIIAGEVEPSYDSTGSRRKAPPCHTLLDEVDDVPIRIEDGTGSVEAHLGGATVFAEETAQIISNDNRAPPLQLVDLLREKYGIHTVTDRGIIKTLHFNEEVLRVGTTVTIAGLVEKLESGTLCFRRGSPLVVSEYGVPQEAESARYWAIGYTVCAGAALGVGLACLLGAFVLIMKASLAR